MAIQKFALYDLIVDIIPGAILLVVLYSVAPTGLYEQFPGISSSLVPGTVVILFSYPVGRIAVHGISSKIEDQLLSLYPSSLSNFINRKLSGKLIGAPSADVSRNKKPPSKEQSENSNILLEDWFNNSETIPSDVSSSVVEDVHNGLKNIGGSETNPVALRRYGENILFSRETLYGKYEILSTFYRHMTFVSLSASLIYLFYLVLHRSGYSSQLVSGGSAPISDWSLAPSVVLLVGALGTFYLCLWRWKDWNKSRNRAFINDLHTYLRERDLIGRDERENPPGIN